MKNYVLNLRKKVGNMPIILVWSTILVINNNWEVLLQKRSDSKDWWLPGWAMELWESFEETAKRELFEETNLKCNNLNFLQIFSWKDFYYKYPNGDKTYNIIALFKTINLKWKLKINDNESLELKYFKIDDFPKKLEHRASLILKNIRNYI